jgi:glycosyltransferase involved in cell wall biosynthesis
MDFSIVTPSFKQLDYLACCIASVADQGMGNGGRRTEDGGQGGNEGMCESGKGALLRSVSAGSQSYAGLAEQLSVEHIVQDAGSPGIEEFAERTAERLLQKYGGERVTKLEAFELLHIRTSHGYSLRIFKEKDEGMYDAVNKGLKKGTGKICAYLNCDEQYLTGALKKIFREFNKDKETQILYAGFLVVDKNGQLLSIQQAVKQSWQHIVTSHLANFSCATFFRRDSLNKKKGWFDTNYKSCADALWNVMILRSKAKTRIIRDITSVFSELDSNQGLREAGILEANRIKRASAWWVRSLGLLWKIQHRIKKLTLGYYRTKTISYAIYEKKNISQRTYYQNVKGSPFWRSRLFLKSKAEKNSRTKKNQTKVAVLVLTLGLAPYRLTFCRHLANKLKKYGKILVLQRSGATDSYKWEIKKNKGGNISIVSVSDEKVLVQKKNEKTLRRGMFQTPPTLRQMVEMIRAQPRLVITVEQSVFCWPALLYCLWKGIPLLLETDMGPQGRKSLPTYKRVNQFIYQKLSTLVLAKTKDAADQNHKAYFVPHAVDSDSFKPTKKNSQKYLTVLFVGIPSYTKGIDLLAAALARVRRSSLIRLRIVGVEKQSVRTLRKQIREKGYDGKLDLVSFRNGDNLIREYQEADLFVLPSRFDTYGVVAHEAACCGLPLLLSKYAGSSSNLILEGESGFVVDPYDRDDFSEKIFRILENKKLRLNMGRKSRAIGVSYDVKKQAEIVAELIKKTLKGRSSRESVLA